MTVLDEVRDRVAQHMLEIVKLWKPGAKITVIVRTPTNDRADFLMSDDDLAQVVALVERRRKGQP